MKFPRRVAAVVMAIIVCLVIVAGCRVASRNRHDKERAARVTAGPETPTGQMYEISRNSNFAAQAAADARLDAIIHLPGEPRPRRVAVKVTEGTWLVPEALYSINPVHGPGVVCNDKVCEVIE